MEKKKVSTEQADKEITGWLDSKKISLSKRKEKEDNINLLIGALEDGTISVNPDGTIVQQLKFGTEGEGGEKGVMELKFKARLKVTTVQACLKGATLGDGFGIIVSLVAALTGEPKGVIKDLDTEDFAIGQALASFFL